MCALTKLRSPSLAHSDRSPLAWASCVAALRTTLERTHRYRASAISERAAGGIFFSGSKAQRSEPFRKKMMPAASPCGGAAIFIEIQSKLFLYVNQIFTYRLELSGSDRIEVLECNSHSPVYLPKRACNMVTPSLLLLYSPGHIVLRGFFMVSCRGNFPVPPVLPPHPVC